MEKIKENARRLQYFSFLIHTKILYNINLRKKLSRKSHPLLLILQQKK